MPNANPPTELHRMQQIIKIHFRFQVQARSSAQQGRRRGGGGCAQTCLVATAPNAMPSSPTILPGCMPLVQHALALSPDGLSRPEHPAPPSPGTGRVQRGRMRRRMLLWLGGVRGGFAKCVTRKQRASATIPPIPHPIPPSSLYRCDRAKRALGKTTPHAT